MGGIRTEYVSHDYFKERVDKLTAEYAKSGNEGEKYKLINEISILFYTKNSRVGIDYYFKHYLEEYQKKHQSYFDDYAFKTLCDEYESEFPGILIKCLNSFNPEKALFRTYFEKSISGTIYRIIKDYIIKRNREVSEEIENTDNEGDENEKHLSDDEVISDYNALNNQGEDKTSRKLNEEYLLIRFISSVLNFYKTKGDSQRAYKKVIQFSAIYTSNIVGMLRLLQNYDFLLILKKHERETLKSLNKNLIDYTYSQNVNSIFEIANNELKTYSQFENVPLSSSPDEEIKTPFEYFILIGFFDKFHNMKITKARISQLEDEFKTNFRPEITS